MKKLCLMMLVVVMVVGLILAGCAKPAPTTPTTPTSPTTTTAPPTTTAVKPITLRYNTFEAATGVPAREVAKPWAEEVNKKTNGRVVIELYTDAALGPPPGAWERLTTGVTDMEYFATSQIAGRFPLNTFNDLPMLGHNSIKASVYMTWDLHNKFPDMYKEAFSQSHLLYLTNTGPNSFSSAKKPIRTIADLKGMKIRVNSAVTGDAVTLLGGTPIFMPVTEVYLALEKGVVDGILMSMIGYRGYKLYDLISYVNDVWMTDNVNWCTMNLNKWNSLPADIQATITNIDAAYKDIHSNAGDAERNWGLNKYKTGEGGKQFIPISDLEMGMWRNTIRPLWDKWVADMNAKGFPGQAMLDEATRLAMKYSQ